MINDSSSTIIKEYLQCGVFYRSRMPASASNCGQRIQYISVIQWHARLGDHNAKSIEIESQSLESV
jgi:hypothetical protein